jgi:hypothetical protein
VDRDVAAGAGESMTALVYGQVMLAGGWDVVPEEDAQQAMSSLPPTSLANMDRNALALGHQVSADKVLYGSVERYTERVGYSYAAASPASVNFTLRFVDLGTKQIIWSAKYAKTQKSLSQNILHLPSFLQNQARWVKAIDIASQGVGEAISDLHSRLNLMPGVKRFPVGGELR